MIEQTCEDTLGHAPDYGIGKAVGLDVATLAADLERGEVVSPRLQEIVQSNPLGGCDFRIEAQRGARRKHKGKGSNGNRWKDRIPRHDVVKSAKQLFAGQLDADLFAGLPDYSGKEARIPGFAAATRQRHMARPRVSGAVGSADEKNGIGVGRDQDGDRGPNQRRVFSGGGGPAGQPRLEPAEPAGQCE